MAGDQRGGSVMREGWAEIWVDRCLWVLGGWLARDLGGGGGTIWAGQSLAGRPLCSLFLLSPSLSFSLSLSVSLEFI